MPELPSSRGISAHVRRPRLDCPPHRPRTECRGKTSLCGNRSDRGRRNGAVHRALPEGTHRRPRRYPAAPSCGPAHLSDRSERPPGHGPQIHPRAGQAHAGAGKADQRRRNQGRARRPLRAVQAEAPHQGDHRPRSRPRPAGRTTARQSKPQSGGDRRKVRLENQGCRLRRRGAGRRPPHRRRDPGGNTGNRRRRTREDVGRGQGPLQRRQGQGGRGRQVL